MSTTCSICVNSCVAQGKNINCDSCHSHIHTDGIGLTVFEIKALELKKWILKCKSVNCQQELKFLPQTRQCNAIQF